jgi:hypothetical protein
MTQLKGIVQTGQGELLDNIQITVKHAGDDSVFSAVTNATGQFDVNVPVGHYTVIATAPGFATTSASVNVVSGQAATVRLFLGGPVPVGEPRTGASAVPAVATRALAQDSLADVPIPTKGAVVVAGEFPGGAELVSWLNAQAARKISLQAILTTGTYGNLFVWISSALPDKFLVFPANTINNPADLQSVIDVNPKITVIGFVWTLHGRFLVLRSNP